MLKQDQHVRAATHRAASQRAERGVIAGYIRELSRGHGRARKDQAAQPGPDRADVRANRDGQRSYAHTSSPGT